MKMKILSPAGDMESLKMAVIHGADEVYLGIKDFNARNIQGFSLSTLKQAVDYAHIFGVKINLAVNILFKDEELNSALDLIVDAYNMGVDSFIVQDLGLISLINKHYPQIELHASTQMGLHNLEGVKAMQQFNFKRVVLSRETPLDEVKRIKQNLDVEIEYFCHGALCVSFSGNCYLSSYLCDASGNRGKCKQLCRLPYSFCYDTKQIKTGYLLSAKDFNMIDRLNELKNSGVDVLKIEGRARRAFYVGAMTQAYRQKLDSENVDNDSILLAFNREFTEGYLNGNNDIISNIQNHIGIKIGVVKKIKKGNKFNEIYITSNRELNPKSTFKFFDKDKEVATISAFDITKQNDLYKITTTQNVKVGNDVNLIIDNNLENQILNKVKKKKIKIYINAIKNKQILAKLNINNKNFEIFGEICAEANNAPLTKQELILNFKKSDLFDVDLDCELEKVFLPKQKLNQFRRDVLDFILNELTKVNRTLLQKLKIKIPEEKHKIDDYQIINSPTGKLTKNIIIYSPEEYNLDDILKVKTIVENNNKKMYLDLPNFALKADVDYLKNIVENNKINIVVNNPYALDFNTEKILGYGMNVYNSVSANVFDYSYISAELEDKPAPYMTLRHCPLKQHLKANCANCPYKDGYYYKMQNGKVLKLRRKKLASCTFYLID